MHNIYSDKGRSGDFVMGVKFHYVEYQGKFLPIISIRLKNKEWVKFRAFVDSGAAYSIFQAEMAEILGLKLEDGKETRVTVGDGSQIEVYIHQIKVDIAGQEFTASIGFSRHLGIGFNIIGRLDIFDRFKICFDETEKVVEFHQKDG